MYSLQFLHCKTGKSLIITIQSWLTLNGKFVINFSNFAPQLWQIIASFYPRGLFCQLRLFIRFALYLVELHSEAVELFLAFVVLTIGVSQVLAEDVPGAAEVGKRGIEPF